MSLRWRWALSIAIVSFVAVAATTAALLLVTERELRGQVDRDLVDRFELAARVIPLVAPRGPFDRGDRDPFEIRPGSGEGFDPSDLVGLDAVIQVTWDGEVLVAGDPPLPVRRPDRGSPPLLETVEIDGASYRMISGPARGRAGATDRVVQVAIHVEGIDRASSLLLRRAIGLGLGLSFLAGLVGWVLARRAVRPIEELTRVADTLAETQDLEQEMPVDAPGEVGSLATSFGRMLASLRASRAQQQRLVADAGHEFRTPLTALRTNLETLSRRGDELTDDQRTELLDAAISETGELSNLATELVDLATDTSAEEAPMEPLELDDVAAAVVDRFRSRTTIPIALAGEGSTVIGRPTELERAVSNLLDNAVKWSDDDGAIEVRLDGRTLTVRDRGPGIPVEDLPLIFERFHRAAAARTTAGAGLGLAIVEHIVAAHGGTVFARNRDGGGAEVGFTLP